MTTIHVSGSLDFRKALDAGAPGDHFKLHEGVYESLDSYTQRVQGGTTWGKRTIIEAYKRKGRLRDRVVFKGKADGFSIRLCHQAATHLEIIGIPLDGQDQAIHALKVGGASNDPGPRSVRFTDVLLTRALHSGGLVTVPTIEFIGGGAFGNGWSRDPDDFNKDHGLYLGAGAWDCLVQDFDTGSNAAYGICEYGGEKVGGVGNNLIRRGFQIENGRQAMRSGVLLSGVGSRAERVMSTGNQYGIHVHSTARDCWFEGYFEGNRDGRVFIHPDAERCIGGIRP